MKSWITLLSVSMLTAGFLMFFLTNETSKNPTEINRSQASLEKTKKITSTNKKITRSIANVMPAKVLTKTQYVGLSEKDLGRYPQSNKRASDWKEKFINSLKIQNENLGNNGISIKHKRSILKKENKSSRNLEHIVVRLKLPNGNPFSYEALIDSETGSMIQSWNRTRYERREPILLDGTNRHFLRSN